VATPVAHGEAEVIQLLVCAWRRMGLPTISGSSRYGSAPLRFPPHSGPPTTQSRTKDSTSNRLLLPAALPPLRSQIPECAFPAQRWGCKRFVRLLRLPRRASDVDPPYQPHRAGLLERLPPHQVRSRSREPARHSRDDLQGRHRCTEAMDAHQRVCVARQCLRALPVQGRPINPP